ncbi:M20/M25/M40 family metallo-hydrolase [Millisia brevis]|uniref:M20/M25/M40 family metallo-hydrolase n=1 Tax=Millisia brevis TaxID=264148 RepID=UPI001470D837|nr:M20/M25/M40 family metallo-hydrolase [Millisia brevis]
MSDPTVGARLVAAIALLTLAAIGTVAVGFAGRVEMRAADAPAEVFSVDRARSAVEPIVDEPRVPGTPEHAAARDYLVRHLSELGWRTEVSEGVGSVEATGDAIERLGRVDNIVATLPGTDPTGSVLIAAHYDTVPGSPGAADDGIGIATALEVARALDATGPHRNTVTVLLTDGEESGLLGAEAFGRALTPSASEAPMVVINNEARGSSGLPAIFRTSTPNAELVRIVSGIRGAALDTGAQAAFELMPNDTDFTRFEEAGLAGLDTAITGSSANYHSVTDTADRLSSESLQRMGDVTLAAAGELAATDLASVNSDGSAVAAAVLDRTVHAPRWVEWLVVAATLVGAAAVVIVRRRAGDRWAALSVAAVAGVAIIPIGAAAAVVPWWVTAILNPTMVSSVVGDPYRPGALQIAGMVTAVAAAMVVAGVLRLRLSRSEVGIGSLLGAVLLVVVAALLPGYALVLGAAVLPAVAGALVVGRVRPTIGVPVVAVAAAPAVAILVPFAVAMFDIGLEIGGAAAGLVAIVLFGCLHPIIDVLMTRRTPRLRDVVPVVAVGLVGVVALSVTAVIANASSVRQPMQESIVYAVDQDTRSAQFVGGTDPKSAWAQQLMPDRGAVELPGRDSQTLPYGSAPVVDLAAPELTVLSDRREGDRRTLEVRLSSGRAASELYLRTVGDVTVAGPVVVAGREVSTADEADRAGLSVRFIGEPTVTVRFTVVGAGDTVELRVADSTPDVSAIPQLVAPEDVVVNAPSTFVSRSVTI